ncbi:metal ABC transporter permease [Candidatus Cerribacteria bacterium 'Amazon FNV 2010 28 9']|uniref:Metal ABC transporter permease n=1 Tax=Candidatus Cerribacteria bacterium 'Amazon FNV 2010 28 9' TaxID=2081795 RepID=A0A317JPC0_9BACT|nr:MAG: metal ABC transporter permease [Candidatus Cerribacteria bacterium 'Amazon FNV 2010 28 9']
MNFIQLLQYGFILRGLEAGIVIALIAPLIGIFLVLRRYSLIADTLSHVSLAGVALGLVFNLNPLLAAIITAVGSAFLIEELRNRQKIQGEGALSLFLSGSLALAVVLISIVHGFSVDIFNYLFGSIVTVTNTDIFIIVALGIIVLFTIVIFYKQLVFSSFDEEAAKVSGINTTWTNRILIILASLTIALSIPIVGVLLIAALMVIPVLTALQWKRSFKETLLIAEGTSLVCVILGSVLSFSFGLSTGGTIVLCCVGCFVGSLGINQSKKHS